MVLSDYIFIVLFYLCRVFPIKKNKIVFSSYLGKGYGDNGKYIAERLLKNKKDYDLVWLSKNPEDVFPEEIRVVKYRSLNSIFEQATAKVWIDNRRKPPFVRKRKKQFYIMTWHSNIALKKVEKDAEHNLEPRYVVGAKHDSKMADIILSGGAWETELMNRAFWYDGRIMQIGYPRQDPFVEHKERLAKKIRQYYNLDENDKILLYAPTFRQSKDQDSLKAYSLDWISTLNALSERFGGKWVGMVRLHPNVSALSGKMKIPSEVINVTSYNDMQELIAGCDCLITDYSSTIIEAGIADKIGLIFATDYDEYKKDRDAYFDIRDDLPFPFSENNEQLANNIRMLDMEYYQDKLHHFLYEEFGVVCNGNASDRIVDLIDQVMEGNYNN